MKVKKKIKKEKKRKERKKKEGAKPRDCTDGVYCLTPLRQSLSFESRLITKQVSKKKNHDDALIGVASPSNVTRSEASLLNLRVYRMLKL